MAKRYYISRIIGEGSHETPYTSELRVYLYANWPNEQHFEYQALYPLASLWCWHKYDLSQSAHDDVMATLTGIFDFPTGVFSTQVGNIPVAKRNAIQAKLEPIGFDFDWVTGSTTVKEVLKYCIRSLQLASWGEVMIASKNFNLDTLVSNVPVGARDKIKGHMDDLGITHDWITGSHTVGDIIQKIQRHTTGDARRIFGTQSKQWFFQEDDT